MNVIMNLFEIQPVVSEKDSALVVTFQALVSRQDFEKIHSLLDSSWQITAELKTP